MSYEYLVDIAGVIYEMGDIKSIDITRPLFSEFSVGNACSAELDLSFWPKETPPRMAKIMPYMRERGTEQWKPLGTFFLDTRKKSGTLLAIVAFDTMLKAEADWQPKEDAVFPMTMAEASEDIAAAMGTTLDERCSFKDYTIDERPTINQTMRSVLQDIAAAHGGNYIVTNSGQLLLVPLFDSMPPETHYLIDEHGSALLFGGTRILI